MLDEGSDTTIIRQKIVNELNLPGTGQNLKLVGVTGVNHNIDSKLVRFQLMDSKGELVTVEASSVPEVCDLLPTTNWNETKSQWKHLEDLPLMETVGKVDIRLGADHADLMLQFQHRVCRTSRTVRHLDETRMGSSRSRARQTHEQPGPK